MNHNISEIIDRIKQLQPRLKQPRNLLHPLASLQEECGELATEVQIKLGMKDREPGKDGIVGESVDSILCLLDIIALDAPDMTYDELHEILSNKLDKWERKYTTKDKVK